VGIRMRNFDKSVYLETIKANGFLIQIYYHDGIALGWSLTRKEEEIDGQ
jgi:hypothetical protein